MGVACKITRNEFGKVERVESPNGGDSKLYQDALALTNDEQSALLIWAHAHTDGFKDRYGEFDSTEPEIGDVVKDLYLSNDRNLSSEELSMFESLASKTGQTLEELYKTFTRSLFGKKGNFKDKFRGVLSEVGDNLKYTSFKKNFIDLLGKFRNYLSENHIENEEVVEGESDHPLSFKSGEKDDFGFDKKMGVGEIEDYLVKNLKPILGKNITANSVKQALHKLNNADLVDNILENKESFDYVVELLKNKTVAKKMTLDEEGNLVPVLENDRYETLLNVLQVGESKLDFSNAVDTLRLIPDEVWYETDSVVEVLEDVMFEGAEAGIDLSGLSEMWYNKSKEEIIGLLDYIDDFNIKTENNNIEQSDIRELADVLNEFFEDSVSEDMEVVPLIKGLEDTSLISVKGQTSELEMYRQGYVKVKDNIYQPVEVGSTYEEVLEQTMEALRNDVTMLPKKAFYDFGLNKKGDYDIDAILDSKNADKVKHSISRYVDSKVSEQIHYEENSYNDMRAMTLAKEMLNPEHVKDTGQEVRELSSFEGDFEYLTSEFISDFGIDAINEKLNNSELYDKFYKHFTVDSTGLNLKNLSTQELSEMAHILNKNESLKEDIVNYAKVSKNNSLAPLRQMFQEDVEIDIDDARNFAVSYPDKIQKYKGSYERLSPNTVVTPEMSTPFIRMSDGIYELVTKKDGVSQYGRIEIISDGDYYLPNASTPVIEDFDIENYKQEESEFVEKMSVLDNSRISKMMRNFTC